MSPVPQEYIVERFENAQLENSSSKLSGTLVGLNSIQHQTAVALRSRVAASVRNTSHSRRRQLIDNSG